MWLHYLALVAATYAYARRLGLTPWGGAWRAGVLALRVPGDPRDARAVLLPDALPAARAVAGRRLRRDGPAGLAGGAGTGRSGRNGRSGISRSRCGRTAWSWPTGLWRVAADRRPWRRGAGLVAAVAWGGAVAAVQLALSWDLARTVGHTARPLHDMAFFSFPPSHWIEPALPWFFRGLRYGAEDPYFLSQGTTGFEAMFYVGTVPLILAFVGALDVGRGRGGDWLLAAARPVELRPGHDAAVVACRVTPRSCKCPASATSAPRRGTRC